MWCFQYLIVLTAGVNIVVSTVLIVTTQYLSSYNKDLNCFGSRSLLKQRFYSHLNTFA